MKHSRGSWRQHLLLSLLVAVPYLSWAQEEVILAPVTQTYALTNATIVQGPGRKLEGATLVIKDGIIKAVGKGVSVPSEAIIIKADSLFIYAGFIDGLSRVGVIKPKEENKDKVKDPGNPPPDRAGINPQLDVRSFLNPSDKSVEELRAVGFTVAQVVPHGGMLPGNGAIVMLGGSSADNMVLINNSTFYSELTSADRMYPATTIGVMAKWRELYRQATLAKNYESLYASNRNGLERPATDRVLQAFYPVIDKRQPVLFKSEKVLDVQRVLSLQNDLGFSLQLADVKEGWDVMNKIKASNAKVFLTLDLPEEKKEEKKADSKDGKKEEKPKTAADLEKEALEKRKADFATKYTAQPAAFQKAGITFGFSTLSAKAKDIPANLRRMIATGLTEDQALAALTTSPAQLLGLSDRLGTIDNGKIANLVVTTKSYFHEKAKVKYVFIDGMLYKQEVKEEKKSDGKKVDVAGTWSYTAETPQGSNTGVMKLKKDSNDLAGTITSSMSNKEYDMKDIVQDGNKLSFYYSIDFGGNSMKVEISITVDGDSFEGTMTAGRFGSFPIKGSKEPGN
jgi:imidazolonepropionase-like amidohydrolase